MLLLAVGMLRASASSAAPSPREQKLLDLGSGLGSERLEILTWPARAELHRLKVAPFEKDRQAIGAFRGREVLATRTLPGREMRLLADAFLDVGSYASLGIRKPVRPGPVGYGAARLCGGFRPIVGLHLTDVEDRSLDILLCFSCDEMAFAAVETDQAPRTDAERHFWISSSGAVRLLGILARLLPEDESLRWLLQDGRRRQTRSRRPE